MTKKVTDLFKFGYDQERNEYILVSQDGRIGVALSPYLTSHLNFKNFEELDDAHLSLGVFYRYCAKAISHQTLSFMFAMQYKVFKKRLSLFLKLFEEICDELGYMLKLDVDTCDTCVRCFLYEDCNDDLADYVASAIIMR